MQPTPEMTAASGIARRLREDGHEAWIAGGAVRDWLLGRIPHDVDVATSAHPDRVAELFPHAKLVGVSFGVVVVPVDDLQIEVATFRTEGLYLDGRRPSEVEFGTLEQDVRRRDFTVNGMFLDLDTDEVRDLIGGQADLELRVLRAIGDPVDRFREDHLRLLRAVRLAAQLGFTIEARTQEAVTANAGLAAEVAPERTRDELLRMLTGPDPERALELMHELGLLRVLLPEVAAMEGVEQPAEYHPEGDVFTHTKALFRYVDGPSPELALGCLLHDVGKPPTFERAPDRIRFSRHARVGAEMADEICRRLRLSNESRDRVVALVSDHMHFMEVENMRPATLKRFLRRPGIAEHLALHRADCLASHRQLGHWDFVRGKLAEFGEEELSPAPLVSGYDLMQMGWERGPALGRELSRIEEMQLNGELTTREEALERARLDLDPGAEAGPA